MTGLIDRIWPYFILIRYHNLIIFNLVVFININIVYKLNIYDLITNNNPGIGKIIYY